jgi:hypothetical protein
MVVAARRSLEDRASALGTIAFFISRNPDEAKRNPEFARQKAGLLAQAARRASHATRLPRAWS